jgi:hypothetical protein
LHFPCDARACIMKELYIERHVILYDRVCRIAPQRSEYGRSHALRSRSSLFPLRHVDAPPSVSTVSPAELVPSNFSQTSVLQFLHCSSPPFHMSLFVPRHIRRQSLTCPRKLKSLLPSPSSERSLLKHRCEVGTTSVRACLLADIVSLRSPITCSSQARTESC